MTSRCAAPLSDRVLTDYWVGELPADEAEAAEEHLFACAICAGRLGSLVSLADAVAELARRGRVSGVISRAVLNRLQRDGVRVRLYSLSPGETVPCAAFPGDDVVVVSMRGDFEGAPAATLTIGTVPGGPVFGSREDVPLSAREGEVLWATPSEIVRRSPPGPLALTLRSADAEQRLLGEYRLDHSAAE
jgi:anti-sigma factor RsiW